MTTKPIIAPLSPLEKQQLTTRGWLLWGVGGIIIGLLSLLTIMVPLTAFSIGIIGAGILLAGLSFGWSGGKFIKDAHKGVVHVQEGRVEQKQVRRIRGAHPKIAEDKLYWAWINGKKWSLLHGQYQVLREGEIIRIRVAPKSQHILAIEKK